MREIKFRVYSEELKKYSTLQEAAIYGKVLPRDNELKVREQYILEQFTGIYDKNGKEIYEGDIVESYFYWEKDYIVKFGNYNNEEQWEDNRSGYGWYLQSLDNEVDTIRELNYRTIIEVIGNIHEGENK